MILLFLLGILVVGAKGTYLEDIFFTELSIQIYMYIVGLIIYTYNRTIFTYNSSLTCNLCTDNLFVEAFASGKFIEPPMDRHRERKRRGALMNPL